MRELGMQGAEKEIRKKIAAKLAELANVGEILKGTVSKVVLGTRKSGRGKKTSYLLTYKGTGNKTRTVYVAKERVAEVKRMIAKYRKARTVIERIVELNVELFKTRK
jgi:hypothetical protein